MFLVPAAVGTLLIAFVVGALSQVGRGSGPAHRTIDRGFAALASIVAARSHATGLSVAELFVNAPHLDRLAFFSSLAAITSQSADEARQLDAAVPPEPLDGAGEGCLAAVQARASATAVIKQSLEGLLGGSDGTSSVSPAQSLASLEAAATTVVQADADWSSCRGAMRRAPGSARVPASAWLAGQGWFTPAALASSVNSVALSRTLAAHHALAVIATNVVPASLPAPSAGPALVAPTKTLMVHVVVTDDGNVAEPAVQVRAVLTGGPSPTALGATVALQAGTSTAVVLGPFSVVPGAAYTVQVLVASSSGAAAASVGKALQVVSEPTSTTTVVTTTTTSTPKHQGIRRSGG